MKSYATLCTTLLFACLATNAQPVVEANGILNAAGLIPPGLPGSGIAQGSMFAVKGIGLGPEELVFPRSLPLPPELEGSSIQVTVDEVTANAYMVYTWTYQLAAVLPSTVPAGDGTLTVTYNGQTSDPTPIRVVQHTVGIFTRNTAGMGPAIVQNWISHTEIPHLNSFTDAAKPGQIEILWATGLGAISGDDAGPPPVGDLPVDVEVLVGGKSAKVLYKGRSYEFPGIDQIQFEVPEGVEGCYVPVAVKAGGVIGNYATMAIAESGGSCSSRTSFTGTDLQQLSQHAEARVGGIALWRLDAGLPSFPVTARLELAMARFFSVDQVALQASMGPLGLTMDTPVPPPGMCTVFKYRFDEAGLLLAPEDPVSADPLDAGTLLTLSGPLGMKQLVRIEDGIYLAELGGEFLPDYLEPGQYRLHNGTGGVDVGPFQAALTIPASSFTWTNRDSIQEVRRTEDLTVTWTDGDPDNEYVIVGGFSARTDLSVAGSFVCIERSSAGHFTVPSRVLSGLPASSELTEWDDFPYMLMLGRIPGMDASKFTALGLDAGYFHYAIVTVSLVPFE